MLLVDLDPQASATAVLGADADDQASIADVLVAGSQALRQVVVPTAWGLDLVPADEVDDGPGHDGACREQGEQGYGPLSKEAAHAVTIGTASHVLRHDMRVGIDFEADCANWVYTLRAYYAWKNGLPFGYTDQIAGRGNDFRFNNAGNRIVGRRDLIDRGNGLTAPAILAPLLPQRILPIGGGDAARHDGASSHFSA